MEAAATAPARPEQARAAESRMVIIAGRANYAALLLTLALSPFEAGYQPIGRILWATFTNLEVAVLILVATWLFKMAVDPTARLRLLKLPLLLPILALVSASMVSTAFGEYKSLGVQFIYRLLMGVVVYASVYETLRSKTRLLTAISTVVVAGSVSAILGLLEFAPGINIQPFLKAFKPFPTTVGGTVRLSGSFEYANGAAMYFEMVLPLVLGLAVLVSSRKLLDMLRTERRLGERKRSGVLLLLFVLSLVYMTALILTFSRASLVGVLIAIGVFGIVSLLRRHGLERWVAPQVWRALGVSVIVIGLSGLFVFATQPMFRLRLTTENDRNWYGATVTSAPIQSLSAHEVVTVPVTLSNYGQMTWSAAGVLPIHVSYHWMSAAEDVYLVFEGLRTPLPHDVSPGETLSVDAIVQAPPRPGDYRLQWDLVHESVTWFEGKQGMRAETRAYHVGEATVVKNQQPPSTNMPPRVSLESNIDLASVGRGQLWKVAFEMFKDHPITGVGPDGFRNLYGEYAGVTQWNKNIYTNNTYIEMFTNLGILGGLAFLWLAGFALYQSARNILRAPVGPMWVIGLGATAAVLAFFVHGMVDYFLFATPLYLLFWFMMSVAVNWPLTTSDGIKRKA